MFRFAAANTVLLAAFTCASLPAQQVSFVPHDVNPAAEFPACAVLDVNKDGKLDIASGGFWYEAPSWKKHFLREVEVIRGRFDDYSNLEMDVNADGWTDIVSVNYRSASIFWIEHPGEVIRTNPDTPWTKHLVDNPGPMETGRLYDIDGDGRLDILPNGTTFAAWYELLPGGQESGARGQGSGGRGQEAGARGQESSGTAGSPNSPGGTAGSSAPPGGTAGLSSSVSPKFVRHDLPMEVAGHGVGFGDINGDGRGDIVGPHGWLEAPEDRRSGRWIWHPEWSLTRDASVPILVHDVDGDGDNDLIWGRGHRFGLYWLEQGGSLEGSGVGVQGSGVGAVGNALRGVPNPAGVTTGSSSGDRTWTWRAIDTSWAQPHSIFLADLNGDKQPELVAGKRYMGHEGNDPGEYDLLCAYSYEFNSTAKTWSRSEIYFNHRAAFGLDPRAADIDGDGDLDLVAADRSSLVLLENLGARAASARTDAANLAKYNHQEPLAIVEGATLRDAQSRADYGVRRFHIQQLMQDGPLGQLPHASRRVPLDVKVESHEEASEYVRVKLSFAAEPGDRVPALLLVPKAVALEPASIRGTLVKRRPASANSRGFGGRLPAMLCLHQTIPAGKSQTAGLVAGKSLHYGKELAERGFVCLIPDYPSFGDYKGYDFKQNAPGSDRPLYESGTMKAIWNNIRAVDLLESLGYVDTDNIGVIGHSLGGHNALFTAVFEPRLKAVVTSCGFTAFHDYMKGDLKGWTSDRYMPKIRDVYGNNPDQMPFDFPEVLAAIAPRGIYVNAPLGDRNFDNQGVRKCIAAAQPVYDLLGGKNQLVVEYPDCGHDFPDDVRERVYQWLEKQLK